MTEPTAAPQPNPTPTPTSGSAQATSDKPVAVVAEPPNPSASSGQAPKPAEPVKFIARPMRIGVVPFLNAQPLVWDMKDHHKLSVVSPNEMADHLKKGRLDVALTPIVAKFLNPELQVVPVVAICSKGPVKSVRILSHGPLEKVTQLFVDGRSQTSSLLAQLILKKWYGVKGLSVKSVDMETFHPNQVKPWEATLQFGDNALIAAPTGMMVTDLGEEWTSRTGKPFVYAVWMARSVPVAREIEMDLLAAKNEGLKHFDEISKAHKGIWVFEQAKSKAYLEKNISYTYGPEENKGQIEFQRLLKEEGLII